MSFTISLEKMEHKKYRVSMKSNDNEIHSYVVECLDKEEKMCKENILDMMIYLSLIHI